MSPTAIALVLVAALLHSVWNIAAKKAGGDDRFALFSGALPLLGERLSLVGIAGVLAVTVGVFFIAGGPRLWAKVHDPAQRNRVRAGLGWGAATGALIAGYTLIDGYAVKLMLISPLLVDYFGNLLRLPFLLPAALRDPASLRAVWNTQWKYALVVAVLGPIGYVLVLYAVRLAPLSHVAPAREVSMLFAALIGGRLLGEGDRGLRFAVRLASRPAWRRWRSAERRGPIAHTRGVMKLSLPLFTLSLLVACAQRPADGIQQQRLDDALRSRPIVLLGEVHDNAAQHAMRAQALRRLLESGARPALLMEQFDREHQADLDRALASPGATPSDVIAAASPGEPAMQGWSWPFYKPYLLLAIDYKLTIVAANVSRNDTRRVLKEGLASFGFEASIPPEIQAAQAAEIGDSHCGMLDADTAARMVGAQVARDQFMARAIEANAARGAVLIAGNGHVRRDVGVPRWLSEGTRARSVAIGLLEGGEPNPAAFDITVSTPAQSRADPCEAMRAPRDAMAR